MRSTEWTEALTDWPPHMSSKRTRDDFWAKIARTQPTPPPSPSQPTDTPSATTSEPPASPTSSTEDAPATTTNTQPKPKATQVKDAALRFIHRCISNTIHHRHNSQGHVTDQDLFLLYGLHEKRAINLAHVLARYLMKFSARKSPGTLSAGCYITILAEHFKILTPEIRAALTPFDETETLDLAMLKDSFIIREDEDGRLRFALEGGALPDELP
ncbi:retrotransposon Orf1 [Artemisia annua]|uniref:Retrotransposon Orf1 n=1 Tax=Artemisia annua TaxID=35608 RepID=A0A2U1MNQ2_ARTAN|nr:retrotransposon Orf1 [Artemisia annua]